jgi:hypothetical protein
MRYCAVHFSFPNIEGFVSYFVYLALITSQLHISGFSKIDNPDKLARRRKTKQKHNTICVGHHYAQTKTNNVNKT